MVGKNKFQVGDVVKIVKSGLGFGPNCIGCVVTIVSTEYTYNNGVGYKTTKPSFGGFNTDKNGFACPVGERSFEFAESPIIEVW